MLLMDPKALTKFARCVDWDDATQVEEAMVLFHQWEESSAISVADALLLLAACVSFNSMYRYISCESC